MNTGTFGAGNCTVLNECNIPNGKRFAASESAMAGVIVSRNRHQQGKIILLAYGNIPTRCRGRERTRPFSKKERLVTVKYVNSDGEESERNSITFCLVFPKLVGVLGSSFLRAGDNTYSRIYRGSQKPAKNHPAHQEKSKGHQHNIKLFGI